MQNLIAKFLSLVNDLSANEILLLIIITAFLLLYIVYRKFGLGAVTALLFVYFIIYIIYRNNIADFYKDNTSDSNKHIEEIEKEMKK